MSGEPTAKARMLKNIRNGLLEKKDNPYPELDPTPLYAQEDESLDIHFATELDKVQGQFIYCENLSDLIQSYRRLLALRKWKDVRIWDSPIKALWTANSLGFSDRKNDLNDAEASLTLCDSLIARNGSVLISSGLACGRGLVILPPVHLVLAYTQQLVLDLKEGLSRLKQQYPESFPSSVVCITGPSRTADIEKTLVLGAHGPKELIVFLVESP